MDIELKEFLENLASKQENNLRREIEVSAERLRNYVSEQLGEQSAGLRQQMAEMEERLSHQINDIRKMHRAREVRFIGLECA